MRFSFTVYTKVTAEHTAGALKSKHLKTEITLSPSGNLDQQTYLNKGLPTKEGSAAMSQTLIQGLIACIHNAHQRGYWDSAEHLRYIISELERGFASVADVSQGTITPD